ncbi:MAG: ribosome-associated translation inhibitor RaiA [Bdellovibrionales bacterium]|jgi:putative sigma-54 modulation protein|nr:ribosome-associated translation inhibitor RaiA [Bdellovibrionales bacterium]
MNINISFRHMESSPAIEEKIHEKCGRLNKFFNGDASIEWVCSVEKDNHISEVNAKVAHHNFHAHSELDSLYKTIDEAVEKLERQMEKEDDKQKEKIHR